MQHQLRGCAIKLTLIGLAGTSGSAMTKAETRAQGTLSEETHKSPIYQYFTLLQRTIRATSKGLFGLLLPITSLLCSVALLLAGSGLLTTTVHDTLQRALTMSAEAIEADRSICSRPACGKGFLQAVALFRSAAAAIAGGSTMKRAFRVQPTPMGLGYRQSAERPMEACVGAAQRFTGSEMIQTASLPQPSASH